jgi:hypothetical protein
MQSTELASSLIQQAIQLFPAIGAPAVVAQIRKRVPSLSGLLVWPVVVLVAIVLTVLAALLRGDAPAWSTLEQAVRDGVALGVIALGLHHLAKGKVQTPVAALEERPSAVKTIPAPPPAPSTAGNVEPSTAWGPEPSGKGT